MPIRIIITIILLFEVILGVADGKEDTHMALKQLRKNQDIGKGVSERQYSAIVKITDFETNLPNLNSGSITH